MIHNCNIVRVTGFIALILSAFAGTSCLAAMIYLTTGVSTLGIADMDVTFDPAWVYAVMAVVYYGIAWIATAYVFSPQDKGETPQ